MGSELKVSRGTSLPYEIVVSGTAPIGRIELIQTTRRGTVRTYDGRSFTRVNGKLAFDRSCWTYVRVTQTDRQMAWSSPIWVDTS